jgi:sulfate adenylyltransferase subunit 1
VVEQTLRHAAVTALLRVPHVVLAVNKMDLVDYDQGVFEAIVREFGVPAATAIPLSALAGDNVVRRSSRMGWYEGPTLLDHLESVPVAAERAGAPARLPVQYVIRHGGLRHYAGQLASGTLAVGDSVSVLPSGRTTTVTAIDRLGAPVRRAGAGESVSVTLADALDVSRGDLIAPAGRAPVPTRRLRATVCHLHDRPLTAGDRVLLKHTTRTVKAVVEEVTGGELAVNGIGRVTVRTAEPLALDPYADSRRTGSFLLIDPADGATLTAGMAH